MSRVKSRGTSLEREMARILRSARIKYRTQYPILGRPDFVLIPQKVAIFCDSEFWHGYGWGRKSKAAFKSRRDYWIAKIERNIWRDRLVNRTLRKEGWKVLRFWERAVLKSPAQCVDRIRKARLRSYP
ncbi:MAG: very short patch repair endonuclease [Elusimicrobia bacterium]|nr:very short patch repair endonuclease [Elusimicrobiota bacterium]